VLILLVLGAGAAGLYWWRLPVDAIVKAQPQDATITIAGMTAQGTADLDRIEQGSYEVSVARSGFETSTVQLTVTRLGENSLDISLEPLPQAISLTAHPDEATVAVACGDEVIVTDTGSAMCTIPAGPVLITASLPGHNTIEREYYCDSPLDLEFWMDPEGQVVEGRGTMMSTGAPKGVAISPDGTEIWASILNGPPSIEVYDVATGIRTDEIALGEHGAVEVLFTSDGTKAYASQMETARVYEIDTATHEVLRQFETESSWSKVIELSPDESTLYVANWTGDDVSIIDLKTGTLTKRVATANTPRGLYATENGSTLYVASFDDGILERIDTLWGETETVFDGGGALRHIVGDPERNLLFISDMAKDCIWAHDMSTGKTWVFTETDEKPNTIDLSPDGKVLFVSCRGENNSVSYYMPGPEWGTILLFDAATAEPLDAIIGGNQCTALDVSDDGSLLVFSDFLDNRLRLYAVPSFETLAAGNGGRWISHFTDLSK